MDNLDKNNFRPVKINEENSLLIIPKKKFVSLEILKRFLQSKLSVTFLVIVVSILLLTLIIPATSHYDPKFPVSSRNIQDISFRQPGNSDVFEARLTQTQIFNGVVPWNDSSDIISQTTNTTTGIVTIKYHSHQFINTVLGTDEVGRDIWTRIWSGIGTSFGFAIAISVVQTFIGMFIGMNIGLRAGKNIDTFFMRFIEIISSIPLLLSLIIFSMMWGTSAWTLFSILLLFGWIPAMNLSRIYTIKLKDQEFVYAAMSSGMTKIQIVMRHIFPKIIGRMITLLIRSIPSIIFIEATLIFLGFELPFDVSIGKLIHDASTADALFNNYWYLLTVSLILLILTSSLQIISNNISSAFNPSEKRSTS